MRHCGGNRNKLRGNGNTVWEIGGGLEYPGRDTGQYREYQGRLEGRRDPEPSHYEERPWGGGESTGGCVWEKWDTRGEMITWRMLGHTGDTGRHTKGIRDQWGVGRSKGWNWVALGPHSPGVAFLVEAATVPREDAAGPVEQQPLGALTPLKAPLAAG